MDQALRSKLQLYFVNSIKNLNNNNPTRNVQRLLQVIDSIVKSKSTSNENEPPPSQTNEFQREFKNYSMSNVRIEFFKSFYSTCLSQLLASYNPNLGNSCDSESYSSIKDLFLSVITNVQNFTETFNVIYDTCLSLNPSQQRDFCVFLMGQFLRRHLMRNLFAENLESKSERGDGALSLIENELIQRVTNLPDRFSALLMTNSDRYERKNDLFLPKNYFKIVSIDLWTCLHNLLASNQLKQPTNLRFVSNLFGKICFLGYSEILNETFLKNLLRSSYENEKWQSIARDLIASTSTTYLESVLLNLVNFSSSYQDLENVLGDLVVSNTNVRYFLLDKFIFLKVFKKDKPIQNVIGYLHESPTTRRVLYYELLRKLLHAWSTKASIVNTSHEQHLYLTKCILVCVSFMDASDKEPMASELLKPILNGVEKHLCSPNVRMQTLGMIVGENLMNDLAWAGQSEELKRLKFENLTGLLKYEQTDEVKWLISLRNKPTCESIFKPRQNHDHDHEDTNDLNVLSGGDANQTGASSSTLFENDHLKIKITQTERDSDDDEDDLMPYDLSNDVPLANTKQPAYLRDCLDALIYADDPEKIEITLKSVENLCETYHFELQEICVELLKVLLHKSNAYSIEKFDELKSNAMISVTVHYPIECGQYLTSQFYEQGYSYSQRTDILHVLVMSAQKLSSPNEDPIFDRRIMEAEQQRTSLPSLIAFNKRPLVSGADGGEWREAVQKRIEAKTKIKSSVVNKKSEPKSKQNKYSDVYGHFFFPLLNPYDKKRVHFNMMEQEFELLGKLIYSLAIILYSATNTTVVENMISAFTDFLWAVRNHVESFVRKSIIFGLTIVLMVVSDNQLFISLNNYFLELKFWLQNIISNDPDEECQKRAVDCLNLLGKRVKGKLIGGGS